MVDHDLEVREGCGQVGDLVQLVEEAPGLEDQPAVIELLDAGPEGRVAQGVLGCVALAVGHIGVLVPGDRVPDSLEAALAGRDVRIEHLAGLGAEIHVGVADHRGQQTVIGGQAQYPFGLTDRGQGRRAVLVVVRVAFDEDTADDIADGRHVAAHLGQRVLRGLVHVVVRIDNPDTGVDRLFGEAGPRVFHLGSLVGC